jgi:hypothetical protein
MQRQFKAQVLAAGGTPQPIISTTLNGAIGPVGTPETSLQSIRVVDSSICVAGDWVIIDPAGTNPERVIVEFVPDSTHIKVQGIKFPHLTGVFVQLAIEVAVVTIQDTPANAAELFIGCKGMDKSAGPYLFRLEKLGAGVQPNSYVVSFGDGENAVAVDDLWFDGTTNDSILPSLTVR